MNNTLEFHAELIVGHDGSKPLTLQLYITRDHESDKLGGTADTTVIRPFNIRDNYCFLKGKYKMIEKEKLEKYANKLMFSMENKEYETLQNEFEVILKQMDLISKIKDISEIEPMIFPFVTYEAKLREDIIIDSLTIDEVLRNAKAHAQDQVKVPKVVE